MILQVNEQFHDYEERRFFVNSDDLDEKNPVEAMMLKASKDVDFNQDVFINVDEMRENSDDPDFWEDPVFNRGNENHSGRPDKLVKLTLFFDC